MSMFYQNSAESFISFQTDPTRRLCQSFVGFDLQALRHTIDNGKVFLALWILEIQTLGTQCVHADKDLFFFTLQCLIWKDKLEEGWVYPWSSLKFRIVFCFSILLRDCDTLLSAAIVLAVKPGWQDWWMAGDTLTGTGGTKQTLINRPLCQSVHRETEKTIKLHKRQWGSTVMDPCIAVWLRI